MALIPVSAQESVQGNVEVSDSLSTAVGTYLGSVINSEVARLTQRGFDVDVNVIVDAIGKTLRGENTGFDLQSADRYISSYFESRRPEHPVLSAEAEQAFVDSVGSLAGAVTTPSGLVFIVEVEGEGAMPTDSDVVSVLYTGKFSDGTVFDTTDSPISFAVSDVTPGFSEGLKMMKAGGRYRIVMPASLGYGADGIPGAVPGNAALDFTVELVSF